MIIVVKTYVCDICKDSVTQEFKIDTIDTEMPKLSKLDIPKGWLIHSNGNVICDKHIQEV